MSSRFLRAMKKRQQEFDEQQQQELSDMFKKKVIKLNESIDAINDSPEVNDDDYRLFMNKFESDVKRFDNSNNKKERPKNVLTDSPQTMSRKKIKKMFTLRREKNVNTEEIKKTCKRQLELRRLYQSGELTSKIFPLSIDKKDKSKKTNLKCITVVETDSEEQLNTDEALRYLKNDGEIDNDLENFLTWDEEPIEEIQNVEEIDLNEKSIPKLNLKNKSEISQPITNSTSELSLNKTPFLSQSNNTSVPKKLKRKQSNFHSSKKNSFLPQELQLFNNSKVQFNSTLSFTEMADCPCSSSSKNNKNKKSNLLESSNFNSKCNKKKEEEKFLFEDKISSDFFFQENLSFQNNLVSLNNLINASTSQPTNSSTNYAIKKQKRSDYEAAHAPKAQKSCLKRSGYRCSNNLKNQGMAFEQKKVGYTMEPTALNYYEIEEGNTLMPYNDVKNIRIPLTTKYTKKIQKSCKNLKSLNLKTAKLNLKDEIEKFLINVRLRKKELNQNFYVPYSRWLIADSVLKSINEKIFKNLIMTRLDMQIKPNWLLKFGLDEVDFDFEVSYIFVAFGLDFSLYTNSGIKETVNLLKDLHDWIKKNLAKKLIKYKKTISSNGKYEKVDIEYNFQIPIIVALTMPEVGENASFRINYNNKLKKFINKFNETEIQNEQKDIKLNFIKILDWSALISSNKKESSRTRQIKPKSTISKENSIKHNDEFLIKTLVTEMCNSYGVILY